MRRGRGSRRGRVSRRESRRGGSIARGKRESSRRDRRGARKRGTSRGSRRDQQEGEEVKPGGESILQRRGRDSIKLLKAEAARGSRRGGNRWAGSN